MNSTVTIKRTDLTQYGPMPKVGQCIVSQDMKKQFCIIRVTKDEIELLPMPTPAELSRERTATP